MIDARGSYTHDRLRAYERELLARLHVESSGPQRSPIPGGLAEKLATLALRMPWFVRHVVLDRWFLRAAESAPDHHDVVAHDSDLVLGSGRRGLLTT